ncbi:MAG TPA: FecR family protein [Marinobacter sp.]|nr:FecR family protein [Marinobacter sp.]
MLKLNFRRLFRALSTSACLALVLPAHAELSIIQGSATPIAKTATTTHPEWMYTLRPGENFYAVAQELLTPAFSPKQLLQYNGMENGTLVSEGDRIHIPLAWLKRQPDPARVVSSSGAVQFISGADGRRRPLTPDTLIRVGDAILSGSGTATISLADGSEVRVSSGSHLEFNRLTQYGKSGMADTRLRLLKGEVHTRVKPIIDGGARFEISTPSAVAAVRGTVFSIQTSPTGTSLQVTHGVVDFGVPGKTRSIPAGYSAQVATGASTEPVIHYLTPAPRVNPLAPKLNRLPAELAWAASQSSGYKLDIFETDSGRWVESRNVQGNKFDISRLDNGDYEIHLAALDSRGIAGMPAIIPVEIDLQARAASLTLPSDGSTANNDMPEFQWQLNGNNEVARVEVSEDESFRELITSSEWAQDTSALPSKPLSPGQYYWRVITEAGGNSVAISKPRKLIVNGSLPPVRIISVNYIDSQVRVFWEKVDTAKEYRLQLSEEPKFDNIIKEATLADTTAALRLIPGRRYFVRLKALSDGPLTSRWGPGRELYLE